MLGNKEPLMLLLGAAKNIDGDRWFARLIISGGIFKSRDR